MLLVRYLRLNTVQRVSRSGAGERDQRVEQAIERDAWGSSHSPVWTPEGWMIVEAGATSQPKRSDWCSWRAHRRPGRRRRSRGRSRGWCGRRPGRDRARSRRAWPRRARRAGRGSRGGGTDDDADVDPLAALDARDDADDGVREGSYARACSTSSRKERAGRGARRDTRRGRRGGTWGGGRSTAPRRAISSPTAVMARGEARIGVHDRPGDGEQHVFAEHRHRLGAASRSGLPPCWR